MRGMILCMQSHGSEHYSNLGEIACPQPPSPQKASIYVHVEWREHLRRHELDLLLSSVLLKHVITCYPLAWLL